MTVDEIKYELFIKQECGTSPYKYNKVWKNSHFRKTLIDLTYHHIDSCKIYRDMINASKFVLNANTRLDDLPFFPASLFKYLVLKSIPDDKIERTLFSSGSSRENVSKIYLDKETSILQMQALTSIVSDVLGKNRLPLLIIDHPKVLKDYLSYSGRAAGIRGFSLFGKDITFALTQEMKPDLNEIAKFLQRVNGQKVFIFGYTYIIWKHFLEELRQKNIKLDLRNAVLIHGGGWKRLKDKQVTDEVFKSQVFDLIGSHKILNYYGMMEQTGSIFMQCDQGFLHCSKYSDIIFRRSGDFSVCEIGEPGIIQTISALPYSYPGHSLVTEDEGILLGEDDCSCGKNGKYFQVTRRLINAQLKGCGDASTIN
jgi:hypothetical protein